VRDERCAEGRGFFCELDELPGLREHAGHVDQAEGKGASPSLEAQPHFFPHGPNLFPVRPPVGAAHDAIAHRIMPDGGDERHRGLRCFEGIQILREHCPVPPLRSGTFKRPQVGLALIAAILGDWSRREAVWVDHLRGETLRHLRLKARIAKRLQRRVGVHVYEAGAEHHAGGIDYLCCVRRG
jgi:hypothetical protein